MKFTILIIGWIAAFAFMALGLFAMRKGLEFLDYAAENDALRIASGFGVVCAAVLAMVWLAK